MRVQCADWLFGFSLRDFDAEVSMLQDGENLRSVSGIERQTRLDELLRSGGTAENETHATDRKKQPSATVKQSHNRRSYHVASVCACSLCAVCYLCGSECLCFLRSRFLREV